MSKSKYVDGFVLVIPKKNVAAYRKMAKEGCEVWKKYGALDYKECVGDDLDHHGMPLLPFTKMTKAKKNETVWFSFITYKSRAHRDQVNKKVMKEMNKNAEKYKDMSMPFDMKRMAFGGFKVVVSS